MIKIRVRRSHVWEAACGPLAVQAVVSLNCRYRSLRVALGGRVWRLVLDDRRWTVNTPWGSWWADRKWSCGPGTTIF